MASTSKIRETDFKTSSAEERAPTFDGPQSSRPRLAPGPVPGDILKNRFVLHQCLAEGSTSRLYRAIDRRREAAGETDPWVALKVVTAVPETRGEEPRALQALRREAAIAHGLEHPNLPHIIGIDHDGPHTFLCMAWLEGESLAAILDSRGPRPMTRVQAVHILDGVARALTHVHALGITHADVKPANILVTSQGEATLLDFGVALGPGAGDLPKALGHTPEYASPQVLAGAEPTPADDLFSLACVAYRMLGGRRVFGTLTARDAEVAGERPTRPDSLSPLQWRALDRALSFARAERQPDVATFLAQLKGARDESAVHADAAPADRWSADTRSEFFDDAERRRSRLLPGLAALAAVAVASIAVLLWQRPPDTTVAVPSPARRDLGVVDRSAIRAETGPAARPPVAPPATPPGPAVRSPAQRPAASARAIQPEKRAPTRVDSSRKAASRGAPQRPPRTAPALRPGAGTGPAELAKPLVPEPGTALPAAPTSPTGEGGGFADTTKAGGSVPFSSLAVRRYTAPAYPVSAAKRGLPGWVDVAFDVAPSGKTRAVRVIAADPPGVFDDAAVKAVRRWRFEEPGDTTVSSQIRLRFDPRR